MSTNDLNCVQFLARLDSALENRESVDDPALRMHAMDCHDCRIQLEDCLLLETAIDSWNQAAARRESTQMPADLVDRVVDVLKNTPTAGRLFGAGDVDEQNEHDDFDEHDGFEDSGADAMATKTSALRKSDSASTEGAPETGTLEWQSKSNISSRHAIRLLFAVLSIAAIAVGLSLQHSNESQVANSKSNSKQKNTGRPIPPDDQSNGPWRHQGNQFAMSNQKAISIKTLISDAQLGLSSLGQNVRDRVATLKEIPISFDVWQNSGDKQPSKPANRPTIVPSKEEDETGRWIKRLFETEQEFGSETTDVLLLLQRQIV